MLRGLMILMTSRKDQNLYHRGHGGFTEVTGKFFTFFLAFRSRDGRARACPELVEGATVAPLINYYLLVGSFWTWSYRGGLGVVADVGSQDPEDYVFGNIGSVVGDAFQVACYE